MQTGKPKLILCSTLLLAMAACSNEPEATAVAQQPSPVSLQPRLTALASAVENAEALRSVKRLQWAYGHYSELGLWYDFADLFADSGVGHYVQGDLNRDQIRALFHDQVGQGRLGLAQGRIYPHISFSPVVDLSADGAQAKGRFRILAMLGGYGGNATWFHGVYENVYVKEQGVWKLNELSNTAQITGNFKSGLTATSNAPFDVPTFPLHFAPEQVGSPAVAAPPISEAELASDNGNAAEQLRTLQRRLDRLQDEAAVTRLQHQYGYSFDEHDWDAVAELFAEQGSFEMDQRGVYIGRDSIRNALNQFGPAGVAEGTIDEHVMFQTYVSIAPDGQSAKARVDQLGMHGSKGGSAAWTQGIYENSFIKENGEWRIQSLHYYPRLITDYAKGWAEDAQPAPGASAEYPADAPPSENYAAFPDFYIPAFHFTHPVTGRAPQYPPGDSAIGKTIGFDSPSLPQQTSGQDSLQSQLDAAELQAQQALAHDAAENLINAYAYYLDECMTQQAATLFAEQGINEIPGIGYYAGAQRISTALQMAYCPNGRQQNALTIHHAVQPVIVVSADAQHAAVVSRLWQVQVAGDENDHYLMGRLEGEMIRENDQWKLASLSTHYDWVAPVNEGWAQATKNETLGYAAPSQMASEFPPDQPARSGRLAPYP